MIFLKEIKQLEKIFSANKYNGSGERDFVIEKGEIPVLISAPHAVNHFRNGKVKSADLYTGGIGAYLQRITNCHFMYSARFCGKDPNYDRIEDNIYQQELKKYVDANKIKVVIDLHGANEKRGFAIEMGTAPDSESDFDKKGDPSLKKYGYIAEEIRYIFENQFRKIENPKEEIWKNRIFDAGGQNTVTKYIYQNTDAISIQLEINRIYRNPENAAELEVLVEGLRETIEYLSSFWEENERLG